MPKAFGVLSKADAGETYLEFAESGSNTTRHQGGTGWIFYIAKGPHRPLDLKPVGHAASRDFLHYLQGAIALELGINSTAGLDTVELRATARRALYSERLADELGLYPTPLDRIGLFSDQIARASRLVMDSGLHTLGWTRQQTVDYMMANSGWAPVDIQNEIDRYISWPAQATSYMLGMIEIRRLRTLAEKTLGDKFDLRGFHDRVVGMGSITLPMLEESIEAWIAEQQASG